MEFKIRSIGTVVNSRRELQDDFWGSVVSEILLDSDIPEESLDSIQSFSHLEIFYIFHKALESPIVIGSEHPRENKLWPKVGIFAQRKKNRMNHLGATIVELQEVKGRSVFVRNLDAIDGTPIIDIKPVMKEFLPLSEVRQPDWATELMKNYW
ncbi:tRNA (N6-threonylcarbamoyladenosine(37)-N6)-methyltransferase TrmO [Leptospira perolatii]|uniref:tRNA (N6-threonylcarbamoyladenosine(37)-N6)-methyltransferase TrmO n=1 Tax=Leptospira perolatii TaxID=2023191 RepID=A0A2M9ZI61_9LEPT|nr:SAM-dependent methyltransferase [Leptospira perolatii]PJZ68067.1 tRNA (N6-threonylcarbamoyladenosine(37)-N6)-methyltransferase TrmO [Leptospira perolatii]PJZ71702.1 tRNA (N6-threonylcarbamoyladenosine(37)-N6)-methyltransferase TrmO [Leptospira perolatii]